MYKKTMNDDMKTIYRFFAIVGSIKNSDGEFILDDDVMETIDVGCNAVLSELEKRKESAEDKDNILGDEFEEVTKGA